MDFNYDQDFFPSTPSSGQNDSAGGGYDPFGQQESAPYAPSDGGAPDYAYPQKEEYPAREQNADGSSFGPFPSSKRTPPKAPEPEPEVDFSSSFNARESDFLGSKPSIGDLLTKAMDVNASDIHLTVGLPPLLRIRGELIPVSDRKLQMDDTAEYAKNLLGFDELRRKLDESGEVDFSYAIPGVGRYRVNVYRQRKSLAAAIRVIRPKVPTVDELELPPILKDIALKKGGLFLVTGPTGSGKSTTLAAMMRHINENKNCHMITIEDPIEYVHNHGKAMVNQREVNDDTMSFANALRAALREDPDVILVGEMRDFETISTAITASETGHFVMSTLHTSSAAQTIDRVIDVFPPYQQQQIKTQLAAVIEGVLAQRLIRTADGQDRVAAVELMIANDAIRNVIREGKTYQINTIMQTGIKNDMIPMDYYLSSLVKRGLLTYQQGVEHAFDAETFKRYMSAF